MSDDTTVKIDKSALTFDEFEKMCTEAGIAGDKAQMEYDFRMGGALADVVTEVETATEKFAPFNSAHEGFAVLKEEVDELWEQVRVKQGERSLEAMRKEAVQVAAMALRFIADICTEEVVNN